MVGFNSDKFDLSRVEKRCAEHGIEISELQNLNIDLKKILPKRKRGKGKLRRYANDIGYKYSICGLGKSNQNLLYDYPEENFEEYKMKLTDDAAATFQIATEGIPLEILKEYYHEPFDIQYGIFNTRFSNNGGVV